MLIHKHWLIACYTHIMMHRAFDTTAMLSLRLPWGLGAPIDCMHQCPQMSCGVWVEWLVIKMK